MNKNEQTGLSLVELLVALAIGVFMMLGISQIYIDNQKNSRYQAGQIANQENGRFALLLLEQELHKAGYRRRPDDAFENTFPAATTHCGDFSAGQTVRAIDDGICIRYQAIQPEERDCIGNDIAGIPATPYTNSTVVTVSLTIDDGELSCTSDGSGAADTGALLSGITDLVFEYGIDPTEDRTINEYVAAPGTDTVRAVRYSALFASSEKNLAEGISTSKQWQGADLPDDGRLYQVVNSTVTLRNLMP